MKGNARLFVLTLGLGAGALTQTGAAQTLIDTGAAIGIQNTLNSGIGAPSPSIVPQMRERLEGIAAQRDAAQSAALNAGTAPAAAPAAGTTPAGTLPATAAAPATGTVAAPPTPLTPDQEVRLTEGYSALEAGQLPQARATFERLVAEHYAHPEPHYGLALTLLAQDNLAGAEFEFGQMMTLAPERYEAPYNLGVMAVRRGQYESARALFQQASERAAASAPTDVQLYILDALASEQVRAQDYAGLRDTLTRMVALAPQDAALKVRLAQAQVLTGEGTAALPNAYEALGQQPTRADAALLLSDIYEAQGLPDRALSELNAVLETAESADRARLQLRRAQLLADTEQLPLAVEAAREAVSLNDSSAAAFAQLGHLQVRSGNRTDALEAYRRAAMLEPNNADYRTELAALRLGLGRRADARRDANMVLKMNTTDATRARAELVLGLLDYQNRDYERAATGLRSSLAKVPSADGYLWLGLAEYARKDYAASAEALGESVRINPSEVARQNLASALLAAGRYPEAEALLSALSAENPGNAEVWYLLGLTQKAQNRSDEARTAFKAAANLGHSNARKALR